MPTANKDSLGPNSISPSANGKSHAIKAGLGAPRIGAQTDEEKAHNSTSPPEPARSIGGWRWVLAGKKDSSLTAENQMWID